MGADTGVASIDPGWSHLDRGDWAAAARHFDDAIAEGDGEPRTLEGRAWAAWWLSDASTLFPLRERTFHAYRERGDRASAARAAIWLASDHHDFRAEHAIANGWFQRARRLLTDLPTVAEHGWLAFLEGAYAIELADDTETARTRAAEAQAVGRMLSLPDLVFVGLALEGLALVTEGAVEAGMRCLDEASLAATSGEVRERIATTWTLCYMIYACERVRDFDRTAQWCKKMESVASKFGADLAVGVCRAHYGGLLVFHGDWARAEQELQQAAVALAKARPPAVAESDARLGELRRRQGRYDEAADLFAGAVPHPLAVLGMANLALDRGVPRDAIDPLDDLVGSLPGGSVTQLADAMHLLGIAHARLGGLDSAMTAAKTLGHIASMVESKPLAAMVSAVRGAISIAAGDDHAARRHHATAADLFARGGLPYEAALARGDLAQVLDRLGRRDEASTHARAAAGQLRAMGADHAAARIELRWSSSDAPASASPQVPGLTPRECEVLAALADGLTDREIAELLTISAHTVHRHVSNIFTKLGVPSRAAAVAHGMRHGIGR